MTGDTEVGEGVAGGLADTIVEGPLLGINKRMLSPQEPAKAD